MLQKADDRLKSQVEQILSCRGIRPPCKVTVSVRNGIVTLAGVVQYGHQKHTAVHACRAASGVKHVIDNLQIPPPRPVWAANQHAHPSGTSHHHHVTPTQQNPATPNQQISATPNQQVSVSRQDVVTTSQQTPDRPSPEKNQHVSS